MTAMQLANQAEGYGTASISLGLGATHHQAARHRFPPSWTGEPRHYIDKRISAIRSGATEFEPLPLNS